jgi:hypothetical protein
LTKKIYRFANGSEVFFVATKKTVEKKTTSKTKKTTTTSKKEDGLLVCNTAHLAQMFGTTERQIYNQVDNGIAVKIGPNKFDCIQSVSNYIAQIREQEKMRNQQPEKIKSATEAVKLKHEQLKSRKTELQILQMEGKLHYEEDVKALWNNGVVAVKSRLQSIGVKLAPQLRGEIDEALIQEYIDREIYDALKEISGYDASAFEKDYSTSEFGLKDEEDDDD